MPILVLKNRPSQKLIKLYERALKIELKRINSVVSQILADEGLISDSLESALTRIAAAVQKNGINQFLGAFASAAFKKVWNPVVTHKIPIINPSETTNAYVSNWIKAESLSGDDLLDTYAQGLRRIVADGYLKGASKRDIEVQLSQTYQKSRRQARFIARNGLAELNDQLTLERDKQIGVKRFKWRTVQDQRVRHDHAKLNGQEFGLKGALINGKYLRPGEDYNCRCYSESVVEF